MAPMWVVAADSGVCRIFAAGDAGGALQELEVLVHPEARLRERELVSDRPGRTFDSRGAGRHAKEVPVGPKRHQALVFAGRIAARLEAGRLERAFDRLALVAAPRILGLLRERLTPQVRARIVHEIAKNLSRRDAETIAARVPGIAAAGVLSQKPEAMQLRYMQTLTQIAGDKSSTIVFPLPLDILQALKKNELRRAPGAARARETQVGGHAVARLGEHHVARHEPRHRQRLVRAVAQHVLRRLRVPAARCLACRAYAKAKVARNTSIAAGAT